MSNKNNSRVLNRNTNESNINEISKDRTFEKNKEMLDHPNHNTCCHVCHISIKQRPRQVLYCTKCNIIICRFCLEEKWTTNQWINSDNWVCHKCRGLCNCKYCKVKKSKNKKETAILQKEEKKDQQIKKKKREISNHNSEDDDSYSSYTSSSFTQNKKTRKSDQSDNEIDNKDKEIDQQIKQEDNKQETISFSGLGLTIYNGDITDEKKLQDLILRKERCNQVMKQMNQLLNLIHNESDLINEEISRISSIISKTENISKEKIQIKKSSLTRTDQFPLL